jgi:DNA-binding response OmpR family regulator
MDGSGRILVVEDDDEARGLLSEFLVEEGFAVETAPDGAAALAKLAEFPADILLTDLEMPGMSGADLIRRFHALEPDRPMMLMSAHWRSSELASVVDGDLEVTYIEKPIDLPYLSATIRQRLASAAGTDAERDELRFHAR